MESEVPPEHVKPLFVRLAAPEADRLSEVAAATGKSKRRLVSEAVRRHLDEDSGLVVGRVSLREADVEVMTLGEAAQLLRVDEQSLRQSAERGELPSRLIAGEWRFSRDALLAWLGGSCAAGDRPEHGGTTPGAATAPDARSASRRSRRGDN